MKNIKTNVLYILLLITLILLCFSIYYTYLSYTKYTLAKEETKFSQFLEALESTNDSLNLERLDTLRYLTLGDVSSAERLAQRRLMIDGTLVSLSAFVQRYQQFHYFIAHTNELIWVLKTARKEVDIGKVSYANILINIYHTKVLAINKAILKELIKTEKPVDIDEHLNFYKTYFLLKENSNYENTYIQYFLFSSTLMNSEDRNIWKEIVTQDTLPSLEYKTDKPLSENEYKDILSLEREMILSDSTRGKYSVSSEGWQDKMDSKIKYYKTLQIQIRKNISEVEEIYINHYFRYMMAYFIGLFLLTLVFLKLLSLYTTKKNNRLISSDTLKDLSLVFNDSQQKEIKRLMKHGNVDHIYRFLIQAIKDANQTKDLFLASMSHEIRTPLNGILGFTQLLKESDEKEEQLECISIIEKSSENLLTIVNDILDLSKIKAAKVELECIEFDPIDSFEVAVESYAAKASEENIDFNIYLDPTLPTVLIGDPTKISQIIINLISNAIKFTSKNGEVNIDIVKLGENQENVQIKFSVSDTGIGISDEQKKNIFDAFTQADVSTSRKYGGTGLGLSISGKFVELMGGKLNIKSIQHKGSTFYFTLALEKSEKSIKREVERHDELTVGVLNPHIDDEYFINRNLETYIEYTGAKVVHYTDKSLLAIRDTAKLPKILFIDQKFRQRGEEIEKFLDLNTKIVLLTTADQKRSLNRYRSRIDKILYKPINFTKTLKVLSNNDETIERSKKLYFEYVHILVAEDNIINQKLILNVLNKLGIEVSIVNNGQEALDMRINHKYDMILMDIEMPIMGGMEASGKILIYEKNSNERHVPIVALTANAISGDREKYIGAGMDDYISKPIQLDTLYKLLLEYFEDRVI